MSVYFATCREANAVKIGSSVDPHGRLPELQLACPLRLTIEAILPGNHEQEFEFHRRFEDARIHGEWFTITSMIESIIEHNPAPPPPEKPGRQERAERPAKSLKPKPNAQMAWQQRSDRKRYEAAMADMRRRAGA